MSSVKRMFQSYERLADKGWEATKNDPVAPMLGALLGIAIYFKWVIDWGAGEWFLAYGILNVVIGLAVVAHHDYTKWKEAKQ